MFYWTHFPYVLCEWSQRQLASHLVTNKVEAAGWHHTQTHGPVKFCEPGFGGNCDSYSAWVPAFRCIYHDCVTYALYCFIFHPQHYCYLPVVIFQSNGNSVITGFTGAGLEARDDMHHQRVKTYLYSFRCVKLLCSLCTTFTSEANVSHEMSKQGKKNDQSN